MLRRIAAQMSKPIRCVLSWLRGRLEGVVFLAVAPILLAHGVLCRTRGGRAVTGAWGHVLARWRWLAAHGLRGVREAWWGTLQYESTRKVWRHVLLTEWVETGRALVASADAKEIMVHVPGHIGDLLHTVPMLAELRRQKPAARISLVVGPWCEGLAKQIAPVDEIVVHAPQLIQWGRGVAANSWSVTRELKILRQCREKRVDVLITTSPIDPSLLLFSRGVAPRQWIATGTCPDCYRAEADVILAYDRHQYEAQRIMGLLKPLGLDIAEARLQWNVDVDRESIGELPELGVDRWVALAPGAGWPGKQWPAERFACLGDWVSDRYVAKVVLMGSADERELSAGIAAAMHQESVNVAGRTSLVGAAQVLKQCALLVTNDNGLLHVAAAVGTPTLALFGPTLPEQWAPRGEGHAVVRGTFTCGDCHPWHSRARCQTEESCMNSISVETVKQAVERMECLTERKE